MNICRKNEKQKSTTYQISRYLQDQYRQDILRAPSKVASTEVKCVNWTFRHKDNTTASRGDAMTSTALPLILSFSPGYPSTLSRYWRFSAKTWFETLNSEYFYYCLTVTNQRHRTVVRSISSAPPTCMPGNSGLLKVLKIYMPYIKLRVLITRLIGSRSHVEIVERTT